MLQGSHKSLYPLPRDERTSIDLPCVVVPALNAGDVLFFGGPTHGATAWRADPCTLGSYSYARPGKTDARKVLAGALDKKLYFAGEATMPQAYSTVHGAFLSGQAVARQILRDRG